MKRKSILASLLPLILLLAFPVVALAQTYYQPLTISNSGSTDYTQVPLNFTINNTALVNNLYITSSGLDTRVTSSGTTLPHMLTNNQVYFVMPSINHGISTSAHYTMGNDPLTSFYIIPGYGGNVTVADSESLEPGNNFMIEQSGWVDTSLGSNKNLIYKEGAFKTYIGAASSITSVRPSTISDTLQYSNDAEHSTTSTSYVLAAEIILTKEVPQARVKFDLKSSSSGYNAKGRVYKNNAPIGTEQSTTSISYVTKSEDLVLNAVSGDKIQLYIMTSSPFETAYENNFRIYFTPSVSVTATDVSSGEHTVKTTADTTNLKIYVDGILKDSAALNGVSITDNANNWILFQNNVMPYANYVKMDVSGTQKLWLQPNNIISGTTLPDRSGNSNNGTINFGTNPDGISIATGSLIPFQTSEISEEDQEEVVFTPLTNPPSTPSGWILDENTTQYNVIPGSEALNELAGVGGIPLRLFWVPVMFILAIFLGFTLYAKTKHLLASAIASGILLIFFAAIGMLDVWVLLIYGVIATALCVSEQVYGW